MISNGFLKFIYQISIEFWITNTLLLKFFQTDMILFDQFRKVPTIKFGKCFAEFIIPIALLKKFDSQTFFMIFEVSNMKKGCGKANKLRYIYTIRGTSRDIAIKERKINNIKIKIIPFIIFLAETVSL